MRSSLVGLMIAGMVFWASPAAAQGLAFEIPMPNWDQPSQYNDFAEGMENLDSWGNLGPTYQPPAYQPPAYADPWSPDTSFVDEMPSGEELLRQQLQEWDRQGDRAREEFKAWSEQMYRNRCSGNWGVQTWNECD